MRKIFVIAWKDAIIRFSSKSELLFFIVLPIVFTLILSGGTPSGEQDPRIRLVIADQANTPLSQQIITELENSTAVWPYSTTLDEATDLFDGRQASAVLVIPAGLNAASLQAGTAQVELKQQPNNMNALVAKQAVQTALRRVSSSVGAAQNAVEMAEAQQPFVSEADRQAYFNDALTLAQNIQQDAPERVTVIEGTTPDQIEYDPRANSSAGQLITWVFIPLFGISELFVFERTQGTLRRLLTSPTHKGTYMFGTIFGQVVVALLQMFLLVVFGIVVMKLPWNESPVALAVILTTSALAAASIGTTLGSFVKSSGQANGLSIMLGMSMALLGGCWYPLELFPPFVQQVVKILPTTWAMQGMLDIVLRGRGLLAVLPEAAVLLGFAAVFFTIGVWRFKYE